MSKLDHSFYQREDVVQIARDLVGKKLMTNFDSFPTGGIITETEAYAGVIDKASHSFGDKRTERTEIMYGPAGKAYVYLCYGVHHLFNVVTNVEGTPHAVLVRAVMPTDGIEFMAARRGLNMKDKGVTTGPGKLTQALGIQTFHTGHDLQSDEIWIEDTNREDELIASSRIGVDYAGEDAKLPYRFTIKDSEWISVAP